jgi:hypothetical protein
LPTPNRKVTCDVHAKNGNGKAKISNVELVTDVCLGGGDQVEGIRDDEDVLDIDQNDANAMDEGGSWSTSW